jgi:hypothetical protein
MSRYPIAYQLPFIDQCYDVLDVQLEQAGMQYIEAIAIVDIAANITDLSYLLVAGQALATMKLPKGVWWKLTGQPDIMYQPSIGPVGELTEVQDSASVGALQWRYAQGAIQITPSVETMTLKIFYDVVSTNVVDPDTGVVRGTAHILAFDVASEIAGARKGMEQRSAALALKRTRAWQAFKDVIVKNQQSNPVEAKPLHGTLRMGDPFIRASGT